MQEERDRIKEGNRMIGVFMEYGKDWVPLHEDETFNWDEVYYHSSWDWLMPVIKKISSIDVSVFNYNAPIMAELRDRKSLFSQMPLNSEIEDAYSSVVQFIEWYNQQPR